MSERVHMATPNRHRGRHRALCGSQTAGERHTEIPTEVTCPFCSALFLADHPEYVVIPNAPDDGQ